MFAPVTHRQAFRKSIFTQVHTNINNSFLESVIFNDQYNLLFIKNFRLYKYSDQKFPAKHLHIYIYTCSQPWFNCLHLHTRLLVFYDAITLACHMFITAVTVFTLDKPTYIFIPLINNNNNNNNCFYTYTPSPSHKQKKLQGFIGAVHF